MRKVALVSLAVIGTLILVGYSLSRKKVFKNFSEKQPVWIENFIENEVAGPVANPPALLTRCIYKDQEVYYLPPRCCDIPSTLFDSQGEEICSPDGGFTGRGDGKCPDFFEVRKDCLVIWQDNRSQD